MLGAALLAVTFLGALWLILELRGYSPRTFSGLAVGSLAGLVSLVVELVMVERASRSFHATGVNVTFETFFLRLAVVAPLTLFFLRKASGVDHEAFALTYFATFFVYMCWLTWKTYTEPVHWRPKASRAPAARARAACGGQA